MTRTISSREGLSSQQQKSCDLICVQQQSDEASEQTTEEPPSSAKQTPSRGIEIIHATTGRVRIRVTNSGDRLVLNAICQNLRQQDGVQEVTANQQTGSLIVKFDEKRLPLSVLLAIIQQLGIHPSTSSQSASKIDPFAAWKSLDFWKEQGISLIPLMTGLAVTGGLGVSGLAALPVYLITANATRRVIGYLEPQVDSTENKTALGEHTKQRGKQEVTQTSSLTSSLPSSLAPPGKIAYKIVHAIEGRIRFNVPRIAHDRAYARRLERLLKTDNQVISVRMNCDAASIAISYDPGEIPVSHWIGLIQLADEAIPPTIPIKMTEESESQDTDTQQMKLETTHLWSDFKSPALSVTLAFMANLPLAV